MDINILNSHNQIFIEDDSSITLSKDQLAAVIDDNTKGDVFILKIGGSEKLSLKANLGTRYLISRVEYYFDSNVIDGLSISYSENDIDYIELELVYVDNKVEANVNTYAQFFKIQHLSPISYFINVNPDIKYISDSSKDTYNNNHLTSSDINHVYFYDTSEESWRYAQKTWFYEAPSSTRGVRREFPERALLVCDSTSFSIIDIDNLELWMRFNKQVSSVIGNSSPRNSFALNGRIYLSLDDNYLIVIDLANDVFRKYDTLGRYSTSSTIINRNSAVVFSSADVTQYPNKFSSTNINNINGRTVGLSDYICFATASGISLLVDNSAVFNCSEGSVPSKAACISSNDSLYWISYNGLNGEVSYLNDVASVLDDTYFVNSTFNRDGYYDFDTEPGIISEELKSISVK